MVLTADQNEFLKILNRNLIRKDSNYHKPAKKCFTTKKGNMKQKERLEVKEKKKHSNGGALSQGAC